jgi:hypothetical protein
MLLMYDGVNPFKVNGDPFKIVYALLSRVLLKRREFHLSACQHRFKKASVRVALRKKYKLDVVTRVPVVGEPKSDPWVA